MYSSWFCIGKSTQSCHYYTSFESFSNQRKLMVFHWSLSDSKSPQVSRTLLSILADLNNTVVWMISDRPPNSYSTSFLSKLLGTVPSVPITTGITITFMFNIFISRRSRIFCIVRDRRRQTETKGGKYRLLYSYLPTPIYQPLRSGRIWHKVHF